MAQVEDGHVLAALEDAVADRVDGVVAHVDAGKINVFERFFLNLWEETLYVKSRSLVEI